MNLAIKKYGEEKVIKALDLLYKWTRGDIFKYKISDFEPLSVFKPKTMPEKLYKGIRSEMAKNIDWAKRKEISQKILKKYVGKLSSWSTSPTIASKFASGDVVLIIKKPNKKDIFIDISLIPKEYKFKGYIESKILGISNKIYVPDNEKEIIVLVEEETYKKVFAHEVHFSSGEYLGDFKVDTLGLTKRPIYWHISPV